MSTHFSRRRAEAEGRSLFGGDLPDAKSQEADASRPVLLGSSILASLLTLSNAVEVQLGALVVRTFENSELTEAAWNELPEAERETLLQNELDAWNAEVSPDKGITLAEFKKLNKEKMLAALDGKVEIPAEATKAVLIELAEQLFT